MANIFIGNLPYSATAEDIQNLFEPFGQVRYVKLVTDHETGRSKGFGFVDMEADAVAAAIAALHDREMSGRRLVVNEAKPRPNTGHNRSSNWHGNDKPRAAERNDSATKLAETY